MIPDDVEEIIGADSIEQILNILATSMLTITTFSLSTMVAAYSASTQTVTPRATRLLVSDTTTHNVLATFIGTFLYSLVGIIVLSMEAYGGGGRVVLFIVTLAVILAVVTALLRWIDHLTHFGRVNDTTKSVEEAVRGALESRREQPFLGANPLEDPASDVPADASAVTMAQIGYIQHADMAQLQKAAEEAGALIYIVAAPGTFVHPGRPIAYVSDDRLDPDAVRAAFTVEDERSYDQDPLFGLAVMAEIASRALSPGINDPGTAIDVLGRLVRLLALWRERPADIPVTFDRLYLPAIAIDECFDHAFTPIARDGAGMIEVQLRLQKTFAALYHMGDGAMRRSAINHAAGACKRAVGALEMEEDRERVRAAHKAVAAASGQSR